MRVTSTICGGWVEAGAAAAEAQAPSSKLAIINIAKIL
jgi:hypothetical protein